ncbi:DUF5808 domain-containing protein [Clostridium manihotivorum]|uniref:DUF5808 domain-containing protein n=1 Tax=Clostridium manihotivorum TaxID=2320868 RepID=A0A3R5TFY6_9CLOT|nr:DUF5808 domain-containing protein [Clostridium manihotivorum]QAA32546.1 hypothetical protein C1I91_13390 [Clostridium manihotivorum]
MSNIVFIVFLLVQLAFLISILASLKAALDPCNNSVLGVTLPKDKINYNSVQQIEFLYNKNINSLAVVSTLLFVPELLFKIDFQGYPSLIITYFFIWIAFILVASRRVIYSANKKLKALKHNNNWELDKTFNNLDSIEERNGKGKVKNFSYDEDDLWPNGLDYYNPSDDSIIVPKRVGNGKTLNLGNKAGRAIGLTSLALAILSVGGLSLFFLITDFYTPSINIEGDKIEVSDLAYSTVFKSNDIKDVELIDDVPIESKIDGALTSSYARGEFNVNSYGTGKLYIYKKKSPYILIKLKDSYIIYNESDTIKTNSIYDKLKAQVK